MEPNYDESKVPPYTLPDPLTDSSGRKVTTSKGWISSRREEVLQAFQREVYGMTLPPLPFAVQEDERNGEAFGGKALRDQIQLTFLHPKTKISNSLDLLIYRPKTAQPSPVFLSLNFWGNHATTSDPKVRTKESNRIDTPASERTRPRGFDSSRWPYEEILARGYAVVTFYYGDAAPDDPTRWREAIARILMPDGQGQPDLEEPGAISLWAWGLSRCVDYLLTRPEFNPKRLAVIGHSRQGKTALWCAAQDSRLQISISNNSGCGGAAIERRFFGETTAAINKNFPHWFCGNYKKYNDRADAMPIDQHELLALIAPRPVYVASATEDRWADPKGEFLSLVGAVPVYQLLGCTPIPTTTQPSPEHSIYSCCMGYHLRTGGHDITAWDWQQYLNFADSAVVV